MGFQMGRNALKLSTMVGENFEICQSQMARNAFKLSTMVGENFEMHWFKMARNALEDPMETRSGNNGPKTEITT